MDEVEQVIARILWSSSPEEALGIAPGSNASLARAAFKRLALLVHPDKCQQLPRAADAFHILSDACSRLAASQVPLSSILVRAGGGSTAAHERVAHE